MLAGLTGYSIDGIEDDVRAGLTLRSSVVGVRVSSGFARFIHPGSLRTRRTAIFEQRSTLPQRCCLSTVSESCTDQGPGWAGMR